MNALQNKIYSPSPNTPQLAAGSFIVIEKDTRTVLENREDQAQSSRKNARERSERHPVQWCVQIQKPCGQEVR